MVFLGAVAAAAIVDDEPDDRGGSSSESESSERGPAGWPVVGRRVLVVEDDYLVALTTCDLLTETGYTVLGPVVTGEEAVSVALDERPDLVLMDVRLAGKMDGVDAAVDISAAGIPTLFVSAHSDPLTRERGEAASPRGWVEKPFSRAQLLSAVAEALS